MRIFHLVVAAALFATLLSLRADAAANALSADTIYYGGKIITMDPKYPNPSYVAVKDGKIYEVGKGKRFYRLVGDSTKLVNIRERALIPGFVDSHSHFSTTTVFLNTGLDVAAPPFGKVTSITQMLANIKQYITKNNVPPGHKVYGCGYSDHEVVERRHPTKYELDSVSTQHPIVLRHYTGHTLVANSYALNAVGYTDDAQPPAGGIFDRYANGSITGVVKEHSILPLLNKFAISFAELSLKQMNETANLYYSSGVTTGHEMYFSKAEAAVFQKLGDEFPFELNSYFWVSTTDLSDFYDVVANYSTSKAKVRGAKFVHDGSINTYTALNTEPYWVPFENQYDDLTNYVYNNSRSCRTQSCGHNNFLNPEILNTFLTQIHDRDLDVIAHCNGDAAIDHFLNAVKYARSNSKTKSDARFTVIHAHATREDQIDTMKEIGATPSFFSVQIYYYGDMHYRITEGPERASRMNPAGSAVRKNLLFSIHNDSPIVVAGKYNGRNTFIEILDSAVNRQTSSGRVLGEDQKLTVEQALAGMTINAAWQSREQDTKGSITPGKQADLVLLTENPLLYKGKRLKDIFVAATVKAGRLVYGSY